MDRLDPLEKLLLERAEAGDLLDQLGESSPPDLQDTEDLARLPAIRASVLCSLLTRDDWPVASKGVRLRGVRISGPLDLEAAQIRCPLRLEYCYLDDPLPIQLDYAVIPLLIVQRCRLTGLSGNGLTITAGLDLADSVIDSSILLPAARIGGALMCGGIILSASGARDALVGSGMYVRLSAYLNGLRAAGAVVIPRAEIGGQLQFRNARLGKNHAGNSLDAEGVKVGGSVCLDKGFTTAGAVSLSSADITGQLICQGARLGANDDRDSLVGEVMTVRGGMSLDSLPNGTSFNTNGAIRLANSQIAGFLSCRGASLGHNKLKNSLHCQGTIVTGSVYLERGFKAKGAVWLAGATISGQFRCRGAHVGANGYGNALIGDGLRVGGGIAIDALPDGTAFEAQGAIRLAGADITGSLRCGGAQVQANQDGNALVGDEVRVSVAVLLNAGFKAFGAVRLSGARLGGELRCRNAHIMLADHDGDALVGDGMVVGGAVLLDEGFTAAGAVRLSAADIGGDLNLRGAKLGANGEGRSLIGDGIKAGRDIRLERAPDGSPFNARGTVRLPNADIAGSLRCHGARLEGCDQDGDSLICNGLKSGDSVFLSLGFNSVGAVRLARADITGSVSCNGATLGANKDGCSLVCDGSRVSRDVFCGTAQDGGRFVANGALRLIGADVAGVLGCQGAQLQGKDRDGRSLDCGAIRVGGSVHLDHGFTAAGAIQMSRASIQGSLSWVPQEKPTAGVNLEGAWARQVNDDWSNGRTGGYWPDQGLRLAAFTYDGFGGDHAADVRQRLEWIRSQYPHVDQQAKRAAVSLRASANEGSPSGELSSEAETKSPGPLYATQFSMQPYKQLAQVYRRAGQDDEARRVEIVRRQDLRRLGDLPYHRRALNYILDVTIKYGFKTWRILLALVALYLTVLIAFSYAGRVNNLIVPTPGTSGSVHAKASKCTSTYPCFYPAGYSVDLVLPLINVHEADYWRPNGHHSWGWLWVAGTWLATGLGWSFVTLLIVGYSGLARQE